MGWVITYANEREEHFNNLEDEVGIPSNWATFQFLAFYGQPQNCHGTCGCIT